MNNRPLLNIATSSNNQDSPDKLYYDITITNLMTSNTQPPLCRFQETRANPFVINPSEYYMSIIRFTLDTQSLPVFIPEIKSNQSDPNLTIYTVTLSYTYSGITYNAQAPIIWIPQDLSASLPPAPSTNGSQYLGTDYYFAYSYQYFSLLINNAFQTAYNSLDSQITTAGGVLPSNYAPNMTFDTNTNISILNVDVDGYLTGLTDQIFIYFNPALYQLFSSFQANILGYSQLYGKNFEIIVNNYNGANNIPFPANNPTYTACTVYQEYSTIASWCPITSVVFTSNLLPIVSNQVSAPLLYIDGQILQSNGNNSNIANVISDFVSDSGIYKPNIVYNPSAQYRLIEMVGSTPCYSVDVEVSWRSRTGSLQPFLMASGSTATIKILFTKKNTSQIK